MMVFNWRRCDNLWPYRLGGDPCLAPLRGTAGEEEDRAQRRAAPPSHFTVHSATECRRWAQRVSSMCESGGKGRSAARATLRDAPMGLLVNPATEKGPWCGSLVLARRLTNCRTCDFQIV